MTLRLVRPCAALCASLLACHDGAPEELGAEALRTHPWSDYHWARAANPFTLTVINSLTSDWDPYFATVLELWGTSTVLDLRQADGLDDLKTRKQCTAPLGGIRVCNADYGFTGWLGIAGVSIDGAHHITRAYTKLNDAYFDLSPYNSEAFAWKQAVLCQEIGHDFGLDHQDEDFDNAPLKSCMDYQDPPTAAPNQHDYEELVTMYTPLDSYSTVGAAVDAGTACKGKGCKGAEAGWGVLLREGPRVQVWERALQGGGRELTFVRLVE